MRPAGKGIVIITTLQGTGSVSLFTLRGAGAEVIATVLYTQVAQNIPRVSVLQLDVIQPEAIAAVSQHIGTMDVLFNCDEQNWWFSFDLNVMYHKSGAFLPGKPAAGGDSIINTSSVAASAKGVPDRFACTVSKTVVIGLTRSGAADYVHQGSRRNAICPSTVNSPLLRQCNTQQALAQGRGVSGMRRPPAREAYRHRHRHRQGSRQHGLVSGQRRQSGTTQVINGRMSN